MFEIYKEYNGEMLTLILEYSPLPLLTQWILQTETIKEDSLRIFTTNILDGLKTMHL